jgi:predicted RecA/RadA family phage recombinase
VTSGLGAQVGKFFGIALQDTTSGVAGEFAVEGVFGIVKDASVFSVGDNVYWDNTGKTITSTANSNLLIGTASAAALTGDATGTVRLSEANTPRLFLTATQQTGTGSSQNIAHGLGVVPTKVLVIPQDNATTSVTYGSHTSTNVVVTIAGSSPKFMVLAWA